MNGETYERVRITPKLAASMLEHNDGNRPITYQHMYRLSEAMKSGEWIYNAEPIKFDTGGRLTDGQHRLTALIRAGLSLEFLVIRGVTPESFKVEGQGKPRGAADTVASMGAAHYNVLGAAIRIIVQIENNALTMTVSNYQIAQAYAAHPLISQSVPVAQKSHKVLMQGMGTAFHYLFSKKDPALADWFFDKLATGADLKEGDPVLTLRNRLLDARSAMFRANIPKRYAMALTIKAWNNTRTGTSIKVLKWLNNEPFPEIK